MKYNTFSKKVIGERCYRHTVSVTTTPSQRCPWGQPHKGAVPVSVKGQSPLIDKIIYQVLPSDYQGHFLGKVMLRSERYGYRKNAL